MLTIKARRAIQKELDLKRLQRASATVFSLLEFETQPEITLQITDDQTIQKFNLQYRGH
jgi:ssRNA-specific RNase YbeY (16S rRNA maturation enzyme)